MLPDTRNRTYIPQVTEVSSDDLNALQDECVRGWRALRGGDLLLGDEFVGTDVDVGRWVVTGSPTVVDDNANGGCGAVHLEGDSATISTKLLPLGDGDFHFSALVRLPVNSGGGSLACFGLADMVAGDWLTFEATQNAAHWSVRWGPTTSVHETDVDVNDDEYLHFEIRRRSGVAKFLINGVEKYSVSSMVSLPGSFVTAHVSNTAGQTKTVMIVDELKLWASRYPLSTLPISALPATEHHESGVAAFTGSNDYVDVVFGTAFADTTYKLIPGAPVVTDSEGPVSIWATAKTTTGCRINSSQPFTGEVAWSASAVIL